jgi:hypothetical protein
MLMSTIQATGVIFFPFFLSKISVDHDFSRTRKKEEDYGMMIHLL